MCPVLRIEFHSRSRFGAAVVQSYFTPCWHCARSSVQAANDFSMVCRAAPSSFRPQRWPPTVVPYLSRLKRNHFAGWGLGRLLGLPPTTGCSSAGAADPHLQMSKSHDVTVLLASRGVQPFSAAARANPFTLGKAYGGGARPIPQRAAASWVKLLHQPAIPPRQSWQFRRPCHSARVVRSCLSSACFRGW